MIEKRDEIIYIVPENVIKNPTQQNAALIQGQSDSNISKKIEEKIENVEQMVNQRVMQVTSQSVRSEGLNKELDKNT